jgi:Casein kinase substrate phosphoprotein PP28
MFSNEIICSEALEAQRKKEEYMRRHLAGETEQAKKDLARLAEVKARREAMAK